MVTGLVPEGTERAAVSMVDRPQGDIRSAETGYFATLGIPLLSGQLFRETDMNRQVAVLSASAAKRAWPGENPVGKRFRMSAQPNQLVEVIGIVGDVRNMGVEASPSLTVYLPYWQRVLNGTSFMVRTETAASNLIPAVRAVIADIDRDVPIDAVRTMEGVISQSVAARSFQTRLLTLFGAIALALSAIGVFGMMSYAVAQRSKELGIRLALGATAGSLQRMVVGSVLRLVGVGVAIGAPLAIAAGYILRDVLFGVTPQDFRILAVSSAVIGSVAIFAGWVPGWRATQIDPVVTLRAE